MAKKITIPYNGKTYTLEYTRKTASIVEKNGFSIGEIDSKPATMLPLLFQGAFMANHGNVKYSTIEDILGTLRNKGELMKTLATMYHEAFATLLDEPEDDEGNAGWEVAE